MGYKRKVRINEKSFLEQDDKNLFVLNGYLNQIQVDTGTFPCEFSIESIDGYVYFEHRQVLGRKILLPRYSITPAINMDRFSQPPLQFDRLFFKNEKVIVKILTGQLLQIQFVMSET